jgi:hypothetical protein
MVQWCYFVRCQRGCMYLKRKRRTKYVDHVQLSKEPKQTIDFVPESKNYNPLLTPLIIITWSPNPLRFPLRSSRSTF